MLFYPSKYPDGTWQPKGLVFEDVWFKSEDGTRIHGWYCPCKQPRAVVLYAHGNAGNLSDYHELLSYFAKDLRVTTLIFDYRGYGRSEGAPTVEGVLKDARAARAFLADHEKIHESQIVLMGRSLGGAVAVTLAAEAEARALILESTFSSLKDVASQHYPELAWIVPATKLNSLKQIVSHKGPLLQSHGEADFTIPFDLGRKLFDAANQPKQFVTIAGGEHNSIPPASYYRELNRFIESLPGD